MNAHSMNTNSKQWVIQRGSTHYIGDPFFAVALVNSHHLTDDIHLQKCLKK